MTNFTVSFDTLPVYFSNDPHIHNIDIYDRKDIPSIGDSFMPFEDYYVSFVQKVNDVQPVDSSLLGFFDFYKIYIEESFFRKDLFPNSGLDVYIAVCKGGI